MSGNKTQQEGIAQRDILERMADHNFWMHDTFMLWPETVWNHGPDEACDIGVTRPLDVPPTRWRTADYDRTWAQIMDACRSAPGNGAIIVRAIFDEETTETAMAFFQEEMQQAQA
ncbi:MULTISPECIES: hypothetical protein [unclassified Methylobacterium]|uniref:hypothetical protein n=1 Tax=unclassified Methylobacterium TaxID=2615210 RepID=UPI0011C1E74F|nr:MULTISPECIES: hypothetical protein [unclassified Methylobacterium]QEE39919.1 hypothetical protein FVA80_14095 [Methylobacterium sp. WL1]TXN56585.1 hypothetical protein FV241_14750 [Methylobacterium sp. WL2]